MAVEKGQKYKGVNSGHTYEILSDPFDIDSVEHVAYRVGPSVVINVQQAHYFLVGSYTLIVEPKYKIGDVVVAFDEELTIEGATKTPDKRGNFTYLVRDNGGLVFAIEERCIAGKVSS